MAFVLSDIKSGGIYAIKEGKRRKTVTVFEDYDDAERYALMLEGEEDNKLDVIEIDDALAILTCKRYNYKYAVITPNDIVIPPPKNDNVSKN